MRVLWFSITASLYSNSSVCLTETNRHNGGGWIASLENIVRNEKSIELGVAFVSREDVGAKFTREGVTYYPMYIKRGMLDSLKDKYTYSDVDKKTLDYCLQVIDDFNPDVIHVFGSECCFGLLAEKTTVPIVIHMQGCFPPYFNARFPPCYGFLEDLFYHISNPKKLMGIILRKHLFKERADREETIISKNKYFMGRTKWDQALVHLYSPEAKYFYCSEALRPAITEGSDLWKDHESKDFRIISIGAGHYLKGYDVVLKAAKLLKQWSNIKFEWLLAGPTKSDLRQFEKMTGIYSKDVNVTALGKKDAKELHTLLLSSNLFVHASYIDNSSNAICEAQYLGLPIIATNSGGTPSLFPVDYDQSLLVSTNDPYYMAERIIEMSNNKEMREHSSKLNRAIATTRHDSSAILRDLLNVYKNICK